MTETVLDHARLRARVGAELAAFLDGRAAELTAISDDLEPVAAAIRTFVLGGGKRLRPAFGYWGWRGAGGTAEADEAIVRAVAALELVHACALMHDDVMDASATRRGAPSVHERFAELHRGSTLAGSPSGFGRAAAILLGDLTLVWADEMLSSAGLPVQATVRARPAYDAMRTEVMAGQYLDVLAQAQPSVSAATALRVARYKSAKYTVERPLHVGGLLHGCSQALLSCYSAYGVPVGEAFQLRDDVLGVYGDPDITGKPAGDDLREGKRTVLIALALEHGSTTQVSEITRLLGDPLLDGAGVQTLREVVEATGARREVETLISRRLDLGVQALRGGQLEPTAATVLAELAEMSTDRIA
ncbi:MAG: polyprenyl synthetase family protein [Geodermatophilaceae bacterium]